MPLTLAQLEFLGTARAEALLTTALPEERLRALHTLRKRCAPPEAAAVFELRRLRRRAAASGRFPEAFAGGLLASDKLLQQASSLRLAVWKGRKLAARTGLAPREVIDLCCGLGSDAIGLARAGFRVRGVDLAPEAVFCARHNAQLAGVADHCRFDLADATTVALDADAVVHVDPDRRAAGRRSARLADHQPGEAFLRALPERTAAGAIKLSPTVDCAVGRLPVDEAEYVSEGGVCRQLIVWWHGPDRPERPRRRATVVFGDAFEPGSVSLPGSDDAAAPLRPPGAWLIEPDPAVLAARVVDDLAARCGLWRIDPALDWLFGDAPPADPQGERLARSYRVLGEAPGRARDVARAVRALDGGLAEIKTRGVKLDTDALQRRLRGRGKRPLAVLWCRTGQRQRAFLCERT